MPLVRRPRQDERSPRDSQVDAERGLVRAVPHHVADYRADGPAVSVSTTSKKSPPSTAWLRPGW